MYVQTLLWNKGLGGTTRPRPELVLSCITINTWNSPSRSLELISPCLADARDSLPVRESDQNLLAAISL
jgi:hypothetical protein